MHKQKYGLLWKRVNNEIFSLLVRVFLELFGCTVDFNSILITNLNEVLYELSTRFHWDLLFYVQIFIWYILLYIVLYFLIGGASY